MLFRSAMHEGQAPSDAPVLALAAPANILDVLAQGGIVSSKSDARRLVQQGGVRIDGETVTSNEQQVTAAAGREIVIQAGKRKFLRITAQ